MSIKSSISLSDSQDSFARALVASGQYGSVSAVLQQGLELLRQKTEAESLELDALRHLVAERIDGPRVTAEEMDSRLAAMIARKADVAS